MPSHYLNRCWLLSIGPLGTNFSEIVIKIQNFSFTKMHLKISSAKRWPFYPGGDELTENRGGNTNSNFVAVLLEATKNQCWLDLILAQPPAILDANMPLCARTRLELGRCCRHQADSGLILAHYGMFSVLWYMCVQKYCLLCWSTIH